MSLIEHAKREFRAAGWTDTDGQFKNDMQEMICNNVLELLEVFTEQGHSGSSAPYAIDMFTLLAGWKPLGPLTGLADEWNEVHKGTYQNKRCSSVFMMDDRFDGKPYDIDGYVFVEKNGSTFTNHYSCKVIEFPYVQHTEYIQLDENGHSDRFPNLGRTDPDPEGSSKIGVEGSVSSGSIGV